MRRVSKGAWAAISLALIASLLCVVSLAKLAAAPRVVHSLAPPREDVRRKVVVTSPDGLLVVESDGAYRVGRDLMRHDLAWPKDVHVDAVASVAPGKDGGLALLIVQKGERRVLLLDRDRAFPGMASAYPVALRAGEIIQRSDDDLVAIPFDLNTAPEMLNLSEKIRLDAIEGVTWIDGAPHLLVGERGAHWLIDTNAKVLPMPGGNTSFWSASMTLRSHHLPFLDSHGVAHPYESGVTWLAFTREADGELMALPIARGLDEAGVLATSLGERRLEVRSDRRRLQISNSQQVAWHSVASTTGRYEFAAFPVGDRWMLVNEDGSEAALIDAAGHGYQPTSAAATVAALSGLPLSAWMGLVGFLFGFAFCVPLMLARTVKALKLLDEPSPRADQPDARGVFFGTLQIPPGTVLGGRKVASGNLRLRAGGIPVDLSPGARRLDDGGPLVDGDQVYVVGAVEHDTKGGPMRATHRRTLGSDGTLHFIGRGTQADFEHHLSGHENNRLIRFALIQLTVALMVLVALGLKPFA